MLNILTATIFCMGVAPTTPMTNVELEVRTNKFSTIRYEIAEGSLSGTAYMQSMGRLERRKNGSHVTAITGDSPNSTKLTFHFHNDEISEAHFSHYSSGMKDVPVDCSIEE